MSARALDIAIAGRLEALDRACRVWCGQPPEYGRAVVETVERHGYAAGDVDRQLDRIARQFRQRRIQRALQYELDELAGDPRTAREVLHLAAPGVPGLLMESVLFGLVVGERHQVRPSARESVMHHFLEFLRHVEPELAASIDLVDDVRWTTPDAARVFGNDDTLLLVRERLGPTARIAGHGSREGVAIVDAGALATVDAWLERLATDIATFGQHGCMSPRVVLVVGADTDAAARVMRSALAAAAERHMPGAADLDDGADADQRARHQHRRILDDAVLTGGTRIVGSGGITVQLRELADMPALEQELARRRAEGTLQTVVATSSETAALAAGYATRVCEPGAAQLPPFRRDPDHMGWFAPLLAER